VRQSRAATVEVGHRDQHDLAAFSSAATLPAWSFRPALATAIHAHAPAAASQPHRCRATPRPPLGHERFAMSTA
jgi:hypothetical protein